MQHYKVPSAECSSCVNHVSSLGLAGDYIAQLHATCSPDSHLSLRAAMCHACRHLSGVVHDLQPVPLSAPGVHNLETLGQQYGAVSGAAGGLGTAMHTSCGATRTSMLAQSTITAEQSAAKLWRVDAAWPLMCPSQGTHCLEDLDNHCCMPRHNKQKASLDGDLMSQAKMVVSSR